jgi:hypothetical protein
LKRIGFNLNGGLNDERWNLNLRLKLTCGDSGEIVEVVGFFEWGEVAFFKSCRQTFD